MVDLLGERPLVTAPGAAAPPVIEIERLNLVFDAGDAPVNALADVDLTVAKGEFVSLIGPSGCGKTTLLRVMADLERASSGRVRINGMSPEAARLERAYGYVFQAPALYAWRNVIRNVTLPLEIMGLPKAARLRRARAVLDLVNLRAFERKFPWQLSGGMQQRVSIARALSFDPALLFMDEPFGALDEIIRDHLNEELLRLWQRTQKTVIFVTHSISGSGVPLDPHHRHEPAPRPHHRCHRQRPARRAHARHPRKRRLCRDRASRARGAQGGTQL